MVNSINQNFRK